MFCKGTIVLLYDYLCHTIRHTCCDYACCIIVGMFDYVLYVCWDIHYITHSHNMYALCGLLCVYHANIIALVMCVSYEGCYARQICYIFVNVTCNDAHKRYVAV